MCIDFRKEPSMSLTTFKVEQIQRVEEYKSLGVVLDYKMRWD